MSYRQLARMAPTTRSVHRVPAIAINATRFSKGLGSHRSSFRTGAGNKKNLKQKTAFLGCSRCNKRFKPCEASSAVPGALGSRSHSGTSKIRKSPAASRRLSLSALTLPRPPRLATVFKLHPGPRWYPFHNPTCPDRCCSLTIVLLVFQKHIVESGSCWQARSSRFWSRLARPARARSAATRASSGRLLLSDRCARIT
jgi:hypothetical protein